MKKVLPSPAQSVLLGLLWIALAGQLDAANVLLAAAIAVAIPLLLAPLGLAAPRVVRWGTAWRLLWVVLWDIVIANIAVLRLVFLHAPRNLRPAFVEVPLATDEPVVTSLFAMIITMTPGTVSCVLDSSRRVILVHALDLPDPGPAAADMKARYERPLLEIFGC